MIGIAAGLQPRQELKICFTRTDGTQVSTLATARLDTPVEVNYYRNGGILQTVLRKLLKKDG